MPLPVHRPFTVISNTSLCNGCFSLLLAPSDGEPLFNFLAGQWVMTHLLNEDGTPWGKAAFSIANAPSEADGKIELAIKIYGDFTKKASQLKVGETVKLQGPYGVFTLRPGTEPLILFAAGIGIAPLRSMLREIIATHDPRPVTLFYTNRERNAIAYESEFREFATAHPSFRAVFTLTGAHPSDWQDEVGRLNEAMLAKNIMDFAHAEYAMCGTREFMDTIKAMLEAKGVDVKTKVRKELFS
ncbi:MAG: FAD-dependent oxidoreductase [Patescibacteria group bacterium]